MFYALLLVCLATEPACDLDHAVFAEQSPPVFSTEASCYRGAMRHLEAEWDDVGLARGVEYVVSVVCEQAEPPENA